MGTDKVVFDVVETEYQVSVLVKKPSMRYIDQWLQLKCAPDLMVAGVAPNAKEISESMAVWSVLQRMRADFADENVVFVSVGDGCIPRTAALMAHRSKWTCISVDPMLKMDGKVWARTKRLTGFAERIQDLRFSYEGEPSLYIAMVHAHVDIPDTIRAFRGCAGPITVICIPCCVDPWGHPRCAEEADHISYLQQRSTRYTDWAVLSPKREVIVIRDFRWTEMERC